MSGIYEAYATEVDDPRSRRTVRRHLQKMAHYNVVETKGETKGTRYRKL